MSIEYKCDRCGKYILHVITTLIIKSYETGTGMLMPKQEIHFCIDCAGIFRKEFKDFIK